MTGSAPNRRANDPPDRLLTLSLVLLRAVVTVGFDSLFVGQFDYSLGLGVIGVAWTDIAVGICLLLPSISNLAAAGVLGLPKWRSLTGWVRDWLRVAAKSGLESVVPNLAFSLMILRLRNEVNEAGLFWVANSEPPQFCWRPISPCYATISSVFKFA